jgi:hypothetical protein
MPATAVAANVAAADRIKARRLTFTDVDRGNLVSLPVLSIVHSSDPVIDLTGAGSKHVENNDRRQARITLIASRSATASPTLRSISRRDSQKGAARSPEMLERRSADISGPLFSSPPATNAYRLRSKSPPSPRPGGSMTTAAARAAYWRSHTRHHCNDQIGWPVMPSGNDGLTTAMA